ncbi:hypothetical protein Goshw_008609, partial [Gossypium schwendimanii]|nr:hypothetical protein [Gossypium schwendimanii]
METKLDHTRMEYVQKRCGFHNGLDVLTSSSQDGLSVAWNGNYLIQVRSYSNNHIDVEISEEDDLNKWRFIEMWEIIKGDYDKRTKYLRKRLVELDGMIRDDNTLAEIIYVKLELNWEMEKEEILFYGALPIKWVGDINHLISGVKRCIDENMNQLLIKKYKEEEIVEVLNSIGPIKAFGPDGFPAIFFQKFWHIVGSKCVRREKLITDNVFLAYEILHTLRNKRVGKKCIMALKIDMSKAYDQGWSLPQKEVLRQCNPLGPFLFLICSEGLSTLLRLENEEGSLRGVKASKKGPHIFHLLFTDDYILFREATDKGTTTFEKVLKEYEVGGQKVQQFRELFRSAKYGGQEETSGIPTLKGSVGTGCDIRIEEDVWVLNVEGLLIRQMISRQNIIRVTDLIDSTTRSWRTELILNTFSKDDAQKILDLPSKLIITAWRATLNYLSTLVNLRIKRLTNEVVCPRCMQGLETREHIFRDCVVTKETWEKLDYAWSHDISQMEFMEWFTWAVTVGRYLGMKYVKIEGDSLTVIKKVKNLNRDKSTIGPYIHDNKEHNAAFYECKFQHARQSANKSAHNLASEGVKRSIGDRDEAHTETESSSGYVEVHGKTSRPRQRDLLTWKEIVPLKARFPSTSAGRADVDAMSCHVARSWGRDFD